MGLDYSLCLIAKRADADSLLENLWTLLDAESRDRIGSKKWSPASESRLIGTTEIDASGIAGIQLTNGESANSYCFSLNIQLERELEPLLADYDWDCFDQPGSFGCMGTSIYAGSQYMLLEMTAATSDMSRVLQQSATVHQAWIELAQQTNALFAYIDVEEPIAIQLFPGAGTLTLPDSEMCSADGHFSVDRLVTYLLATNLE